LRKSGIALVCADTVEWPLMLDVTADFIYCRLHGSAQLYASGYGDRTLHRWASLAQAWAQGDDPRGDYPRRGEHIAESTLPKSAHRDVFVFFDNDAKVRAPQDAATLARFIAAKRNAG
jgi:uncharacterized protein YecE (DUF72 family)